MPRDYFLQLLFTWSTRVVLLSLLLAFLASIGGCSHTLNTSSTGSLTREPPSTNTP